VKTRRSTLLLGLAVALGAAGMSRTAAAQRATNPRAEARKERQEARAANKAENQADREARQQRLAGQVREAFARVAKQRLNLNDDQARRLKDVDDRYETQRNDVTKQEREARQNLRSALAEPNADQSRIDANMAAITNAQKRRAEMLESEQKDLGTFLTPRQRVQYFSLRENYARRIQAVRQNAAAPPEPER
jgi:Spy/CpxP family protein refolding chaperone